MRNIYVRSMRDKIICIFLQVITNIVNFNRRQPSISDNSTFLPRYGEIPQLEHVYYFFETAFGRFSF